MASNHTMFPATNHHWLGKIAGDVYKLFYPTVCAGCSRVLQRGEDVLCLNCRHRLPQTNFHLHPGNPMEKHFWGKLEFERAAAFVHFHKSNSVQRMMHMLKYRGRKDVGYYLGKLYAGELKETEPFDKADLVVPVPLHPFKQRRRGYNQSETIARGLADGLEIPCDTHTLLRRKHTETQTRKSRLERWINVGDMFECTEPGALDNKRVILVDDVVTTGATLEACANTIQKCNKNVKIDIVTAAYASNF